MLILKLLYLELPPSMSVSCIHSQYIYTTRVHMLSAIFSWCLIFNIGYPIIIIRVVFKGNKFGLFLVFHVFSCLCIIKVVYLYILVWRRTFLALVSCSAGTKIIKCTHLTCESSPSTATECLRYSTIKEHCV